MIYTSGQKVLTRKDLQTIAVPNRSDVSSQWKGVPHGVLADAVVARCKKLGFKITKETWYTNPNQSALWGAVDVSAKGTMFDLDLGTPADFSVGVRHDNSGKYAVSFAVGARIAVCSNGMFTGDFVLKHKHTNRLELDQAVEEGLDIYLERMDEVNRFARLMHDTAIDDRDASYIIMQSLERIEDGNPLGCMNLAHLREVYQHWIKPPHQEFSERTEWSLYNAFTETAKTLSPPRQVKMLKGLHTIMSTFAEKGTLTGLVALSGATDPDSEAGQN